PDLSTIPSSPASGFQNFGYMQDSSELLQSNANPNRIFVKVYKSGAFVNSVWYIKILSPQDVQQLGKQEVESFGQNPGEKIQRDFSGHPPSMGSLDF
ncbi:hypothetical protein M8C21_006370, partial [Ambrosia artemisiifolia]